MIRFPATYHGQVFNAHLDASGQVIPTLVEDTVTIDEAVVTPTYRDLREPLHLAFGATLGEVRKGLLYLRLSGRIVVPRDTTEAAAGAKLTDKTLALRRALDPYLCDRDSPTTEGALPFDWSEYTEQPGFAPVIPLRYYARPASAPAIAERVAERRARTWSVIMAVPDPRAYYPTERTLVLTPGSPSGSITNAGTTPAPLKLTIAMSGPGVANFTFRLDGADFVLDLTSGPATIVVLCDAFSGPYGRGRTITKNGIAAPQLRASSPGSWPTLKPGTSAVQILNTSGVTSCTVAWYDAWA